MTLTELKAAKLKEAVQRHVLAEDPYGMRRKWLAELIYEIAEWARDEVTDEFREIIRLEPEGTTYDLTAIECILDDLARKTRV